MIEKWSAPCQVDRSNILNLKMSTFLDTKLSGFYEFSFSNSDGETYPSAECIRFVL